MENLKYIPRVIAFIGFFTIAYAMYFSKSSDSEIMQTPLFISGWALFIIGMVGNSLVRDSNENISPTGLKIAPLGFAVSSVGFFTGADSIISSGLMLFGSILFFVGIWIALKNDEFNKSFNK